MIIADSAMPSGRFLLWAEISESEEVANRRKSPERDPKKEKAKRYRFGGGKKELGVVLWESLPNTSPLNRSASMISMRGCPQGPARQSDQARSLRNNRLETAS